MIEIKKIGEYENKDVFSYLLSNESNLKVEILNYGGIIKSLIFKGVDCALGRDTLEQYLDNRGCLGVTVGRNSNRIAGAKFTLGGKEYILDKNNGNNNLHGGKTKSFMKRVWDAKTVDGVEPKLVLSLFSPDGEEGFPGGANVTVTFTLTKDSAIKISYEGECDKDTLMNLTNHAYFNLNGHNSGTIDNHTVYLDADFYTPNNDECMPYGEILSVSDTAFDLRQGKKFDDVFKSGDKQIDMFGGFDHNFCLRGAGFRKVGFLKGDKTGFEMEIYTDLPGVQIYSSNGLKPKDDYGKEVYKDNATYGIHCGVCFETQMFPNATSFSHFPSTVLRKGEKYFTETMYRFK